MRKCSCGLRNIPISPYHHKTEMPGVPGHHRLSDIGIIPKSCVQTKSQKVCEGDLVHITTNKGSADARIVRIGKTVELIETAVKGGKIVPVSNLIVLKRNAFANYKVKKI